MKNFPARLLGIAVWVLVSLASSSNGQVASEDVGKTLAATVLIKNGSYGQGSGIIVDVVSVGDHNHYFVATVGSLRHMAN